MLVRLPFFICYLLSLIIWVLNPDFEDVEGEPTPVKTSYIIHQTKLYQKVDNLKLLSCYTSFLLSRAIIFLLICFVVVYKKTMSLLFKSTFMYMKAFFFSIYQYIINYLV